MSVPGSATAEDLPNGPVAQSVRVAFQVLRIVTALLALGWLTSNVRQVPPGSQAVVLRFGRVVDTRQSGLVLAWPRPIETVAPLPGPDATQTMPIEAATARVPGIVDAINGAETVPPGAGLYMTGDDGVILLDAALTWRITDAAAYYVASGHVAPAMRRAFLASAVGVTASLPLDAFLSVRPERADDAGAQAARAALRSDLVNGVNARLAALTAAGAPLGVEVTRADVTALLPPSAKSAFDAVLDTTQRAEQNVTSARAEATRARNRAERERDTKLTDARASAVERVGRARSDTAAVSALETTDADARPALLDQVYRDRIGAILRNAGSTVTVDPRSVGRVILPGTP